MAEIFKDRARALEAEYFSKQDETLLQKLRERAALSEIGQALAAKLELGNPELLHRMVALGITAETGAAIFLAPLVQVAWAGGSVSEAECEMVLSQATARGIMPGSPTYATIEAWLKTRPSDALFDAALEAMHAGLEVLPPSEREQRIKVIVDAAHRVADASGGGLLQLLGLVSGTSYSETLVLEAITAKLRGKN